MDIENIKPAFTDERGSIYDLLDDKVDHVGYLTCTKGSIRGKHFHKEQKQYTLVQSGKVKITAKNILDPESKKEIFELREMQQVLFEPYWYHEIEALEDSSLLVFTTKTRSGTNYEKDTIRVSDIDSFVFEK